MHILIAGDIHGHFKILYEIVEYVQDKQGIYIDLILQVGDMGIFPDPSRLDKASRRFAKIDPEEMSFYKFYNGDKEISYIFDKPDIPDLFFVKGNHEDFDYLDSIVSNEPVPVDFFKKMFYIPNGEIVEIECKGERINIAGLGGISYNNSASDKHRKYYTKEETEKILRCNKDIDIFISHEAPYKSISDKSGGKEILEILEKCKPKFHFCGHYHIPGKRLDISCTESYVLNQLNYSTISKNAVGILEILDKENAYFRFLEM